MRTWEQSKRRLSNEKLPGHDSYDDKTALQGWSFSAGEFSNNACTPYLWACDIHVSFVKFAGSNWSNKNVHASQVPISPHPHRRFETTHRSDIAVSYGSMEQLKDLPHFARELMSKATPQKRRRKKKHTQQHSSCLAQWFLLFLPQTSGFLGSFFTIDRYLCEKSQVLIIHRFLFTTKKMVKPHGGTT